MSSAAAGFVNGCAIADTDCASPDIACNLGLALLRPRAAAAPVASLPVTTGVYLRLDASTLSATDGAALAQWPDLSPNGYSMNAVGTSPTFLANQLGGNPVIRFGPAGALSAFLYSGTTAFTASFTLFVVIRRVGGFGVNHHMIGFGNGLCGATSAVDFYLAASNAMALDEQGNAAVLGSATTIVDTNAHAVVLRSDATTPATTFYIDGAQTNTVGAVGAYATSNRIWLGTDCGLAGADNFDGDIAEVVMYSRTLSVAEAAALECYANQKYGIAIAHACP